MGPNVTSTLEPEMAAGPSRIPALSSRYIRFGPFQVDQQRQEVSKNGVRLKLQGKVYQVLLALIEKQGEVVTRDDLRLRLWPADTHVNYDANVNTTVNKLRHILGDSHDRPFYVETIPRRGYTFIANAKFVDQPPVVSRDKSASAAVLSKGTAFPAIKGFFDALEASRWFIAGAISLFVGAMLFGAAVVLFVHRAY